MFEVGGDVDGEAVHRDPLADADAHRGEFGGGVVGTNPDAGRGGVSLGVDAKVSGGLDDGLFEKAHVGVEAEVQAIEVEDGIADELARAVVGDIAAAVGFFEGDAVTCEERGRGEDVRGGTLAATDGDDGIVLDEEDAAKFWGG